MTSIPPWRRSAFRGLELSQALENHPVDYTDIPQTTDFSKARLRYYTVKPVKQSITLRIDADVLAVLKGYGKGYQVKMNNSLNKAKILFFPHH